MDWLGFTIFLIGYLLVGVRARFFDAVTFIQLSEKVISQGPLQIGEGS
jgi:hypothetical protein